MRYKTILKSTNHQNNSPKSWKNSSAAIRMVHSTPFYALFLHFFLKCLVHHLCVTSCPEYNIRCVPSHAYLLGAFRDYITNFTSCLSQHEELTRYCLCSICCAIVKRPHAFTREAIIYSVGASS